MKSTRTSGCRWAASRLRRVASSILMLGILGPGAVGAQGRVVLGLRAGAGVGTGGAPVYGGQIEIVDMDGGSSVELAVTGWGGVRATADHQRRQRTLLFDHHEEMSVWGLGILASYLWRHARETTGPYLVVGVGLGPLWVDWREDSTDPRYGTPAPEGGSFRAENRVMLGSLLNVGIGQRLHERFDVRAQVLTLSVPPTVAREDMKFAPLFTLTSGIAL